jgi:hypothetical protein
MMCAYAYGMIYGCQPEMDLYLSFGACCSTATVYTIAVSVHDSPLAIESLLYSLLESLLESLIGSLLQRAAIREE